MHIIEAGIGTQKIIFVPTKVASDVTTINLKNEIENTSTTLDGTLGTLTTKANYYLFEYDFTTNIENGYFYIIELVDSLSNVVYRGKLYVTQSTILNVNTYVKNNTTNDFVIL